MKKTIAMLLAVSSMMSMSVAAFAQDAENGSDTSSSVSSSDVSSDESNSDSSSDISSDAGSSGDSSSPEGETPAVEPSKFVFKADEEGNLLDETILEPGKEYRFPAYVEIGGKQVAISDELLNDYKFTYTRVTASGVKTFKIEEYKGNYYLFVEVKDTTPTKPVDVKYNVKLVRKSNNLSVFSQEVKFSYGYDESNNDYINSLEKGDIVEIDNSRPVLTKEQFDKIAKLNDYKNVTLAGSGWQYTVNVTDESTKNLVFSNAGIKEVLSKLPNQEFKFFSFAGKPTFNATGKVSLDVSDIADDFSKLYTYRYANGRMYRINATFNAEDETLNFRTNKLDNFVVTDRLIEDGFVVSDAQEDVSGGNNAEAEKENPGTGASDMINAAVMAGIASLAAAGALAVKKNKK